MSTLSGATVFVLSWNKCATLKVELELLGLVDSVLSVDWVSVTS